MKIDNPIVSGSLIVSGSTTITGYLSASTFVGDGSGLSNMYTDSDTLSYINTLGVVSSSAQLSTEISGAFTSTSASLSSRISVLEEFSSSLDATFATDSELSTVSSSLASNISTNDGRLTTIEGKTLISSSIQLSNQTIPGDLTVGGILTAQEFHTEFVSASIIYDSGSTQFGNSLDDIHNFSGSLAVNTNNLFVSGGNVGIGTSSPSEKLDIQGNTSPNSGVYLSVKNSQTQGYSGFAVNGDGVNSFDYVTLQLLNSDVSSYNPVYAGLDNAARLRTGPGINKLTIGTGASKPLIFQTNDADRLTITGTGNVGIGTTNPLTNFHIETSSGVGPLIYLNATGTLSNDDRFGSIIAYSNGNSVAGIQMRRESANDDAYIQFQTQPAGGAIAERMRIKANGNVGINTTSPTFQLHVNGSVAGVGAYVNLSDIDYKKNIYDLTDGLDKVLQLRPVTFNWKNEDYGDRINTGFIAQEVEDVLPNSVITAEDSVKSIATSELIAVLTKAVQELKEEVNELRSEIDLLKTNNQ